MTGLSLIMDRFLNLYGSIRARQQSLKFTCGFLSADLKGQGPTRQSVPRLIVILLSARIRALQCTLVRIMSDYDLLLCLARRALLSLLRALSGLCLSLFLAFCAFSNELDGFHRCLRRMQALF